MTLDLAAGPPAVRRAPLAPFLPAIFNEGGPDSFAGRFLRAFEEAFGEVQTELDAIPDLFRVRPPALLRADAEAGQDRLTLDSSAGLRIGDALRIGAPADLPGGAVEGPSVEVATVASVSSELLPTSLTLSAPLRLSHPAGQTVRLMEPAGSVGQLAVSVSPGSLSVVLVGGETLGAIPGDALLLDSGPLAEHAVVAAVDGGRLLLTLPLLKLHASGQPISLLREAATVTTPTAFAFTDRSGPQHVLRHPARAGHTWLELDSAAGLAVGDLLHLDDPVPAHSEFVTVQALPEEPASPGVRRAIQLAAPLTFAHEAGTGLRILGGAGGPSGATAAGGGTAFLGWLAGWVALETRPDRGERWNRDLLRLHARLQPWRGTARGLEATLNATLREEATAVVRDRPNPLQIGLISTVGVDTSICGDAPGFFGVEIVTDPRNGRLSSPQGLAELARTVQSVVQREKPAHTVYDLLIEASGLRIGVDDAREIGLRVGETSLLWERQLLIRGER